MVVMDWILNALGIIENIFSASIVAILTYMILGGWKYVFRAVSFFFDTQLVKLIGTVFGYFNQLLTLDMFEEKLVDALLRNVYIFIGVIMFFRLMMLVIKYLVNPDLLSDAKSSVGALIQRVIIGCCGILFIPTIFDLANDLQRAILEDSIIQQIIIPKDMIDIMEDKINQGGHFIGTYVLSGFLSPNSSASSSDVKQFDLGIQQGDLSNVDINEGGFLTQKFKYDYFFFISTLALGYTFYYMLKYCIDIAGRCFKLLLYKLLSPIAMIEYMINGSQDGVFKQWLTSTISTYAMLFVRILAIWFVLLVTTLMGEKSGGYAGELLTNNDYFLRAIIIIALLGFMMDLPKLIGQIFGLDLEQEGSAMGVLKQVGGMVKGAAIGGLAIGGAAIGGLTGGLGGAVGARRQAKAAGKAEGLKGKELREQTRKNLKGNLKDLDAGGMFRAGTAGIFAAAMGSNQFTGSAYNSASQNKKSTESIGDNANAQARKKKEEKDLAEEQRSNISKLVQGQEERTVTERVQRVIDANPAGTEKATIQAQVEKISFNGQDSVSWANTAGGSAEAQVKTTAPTTRQEVEQIVTQSVQQTMDASGIQCSNLEPIVQKVMMQAETSGNLDFSLPTDELAVQVKAIATTTMSDVAASSPQVQEITQIVNQEYGTRVNNAIDDATQTITQKIDQQIDVTRNINDNVSQSVEIQKDIRLNTEEINAYTGLTAENTEILKNKE